MQFFFFFLFFSFVGMRAKFSHARTNRSIRCIGCAIFYSFLENIVLLHNMYLICIRASRKKQMEVKNIPAKFGLSIFNCSPSECAHRLSMKVSINYFLDTFD